MKVAEKIIAFLILSYLVFIGVKWMVKLVFVVFIILFLFAICG